MPKARFNQRTVFEGNNVVYHGAMVGDSFIGRNTYIGSGSIMQNCHIGRFCSIASDVKVIAHNHPSSVFVSTSPSFFSTKMQNRQTFVKKDKFDEFLRINGYSLIVGNDVWIGSNALIKGGITIGDGAIIAMGAVVTKDVPPYAIVGGTPAKIIKYRFSPEQIDRLLEIKWWDKPEKWVVSHADDFEDIERFLKQI